MTSFELQVLQGLLDRAWEEELALFLSDLADDLLAGTLTVEQAMYRLDSIRERSNDR